MDETFPDLGSLSDLELKDVIRQLTEEETEISYKRRILHGKIDILRAELVNRLRSQHNGGQITITGDDVQRLTDILTQHQPESPVCSRRLCPVVRSCKRRAAGYTAKPKLAVWQPSPGSALKAMACFGLTR